MIRKLAAAAALAGAALSARPASALLVIGSDPAQGAGPQTRVLVLSEQGRSVVAVAPSARGPVKSLALVLPLPASSVETLRAAPVTLFERTDRLAAPRLDELWELDPCELHPEQQGDPPAGTASAAVTGSATAAAAGTVTEGGYEISILRGEDAANAAKWLGDHGYKVPDGAADALAAALKPGMVLAVARIDGARLTFEKDVARLPPLGFVVTGAVSLPLRLAVASASGPHDVLLDVLSPVGRVEASNLLNVAVPTNLDAREDAKGDLEGLHRAALDYTFEKTPGAAITEYAWPAVSCDGCAPGTAVSAEDLLGLGVERLPSAEDGSLREVMVDVSESLAAAPEGPPALKQAISGCYSKLLGEMHGLAGEAQITVQTGEGGEVKSTKITDAGAEALGKCVEEAARATKLDRPNASGTIKARFGLVGRAYLGKVVFSRMRVRAGKGSGDLELRPAAPIEGGREEGSSGEADKRVSFAEQVNNFRARYVVRHAWPGPISCENPKRGVWGPRPKNFPAPGAKPSASASASPSASASAGASGKPAAPSAAERRLAGLLEGGALPDLQAYAIAFREPPKPPPAPAASTPPPATATAAPATSSSAPPGASGGCGCRAGDAPSGRVGWSALALTVALMAVRRRGAAKRLQG